MLRRYGARILMYWRVHSGSLFRVSSHFILCSEFGKKSIQLPNQQLLQATLGPKRSLFLAKKGEEISQEKPAVRSKDYDTVIVGMGPVRFLAALAAMDRGVLHAAGRLAGRKCLLHQFSEG